MTAFNVGDKVKVVHDFHIWLTDYGLNRETILTVVENDDEYNSYVNADDKTIELGAVKEWPKDFEKVADSYFSGGLLDTANFGLVGEQGCEHVIPAISSVEGDRSWSLSKGGEFNAGELLNCVTNSIDETNLSTLGVYRPNLEDRKVGKIQMHMVDDGFPRALRAVAEVMTWAAEVKGYKLHDWRNLPDADVALPSAAYRHRNDNSVQKAEGFVATARTDHESKLLHKAHEAFNTLAELELILAGVIK
ncbi:hypothetical protein D3C75_448180 [compost metagenome]